MYILSRKHKFVCHLVPKVATRSLLQYFVREPHEDYEAKHVSRVCFTRGYFHFGFMRNPYARLVSAYLNKIKNNNREDVQRILKPHGMYCNMPFYEFIDIVCRENDRKADDHWKSQHLFLKGADVIGTMESIDVDFDNFCFFLRIKNYGLERSNHTTENGGWNYLPTESRNFVDYMNFFDGYTKKLVKERYHKDFRLYEEATS